MFIANEQKQFYISSLCGLLVTILKPEANENFRCHDIILHFTEKKSLEVMYFTRIYHHISEVMYLSCVAPTPQIREFFMLFYMVDVHSEFHENWSFDPDFKSGKHTAW
jgi:hypothetical protein